MRWWYHPDSCDGVKQHLPKILPNHISTHTHTNNNLIIFSFFKISAYNLSFINHPKMYPICFRWPWSSSPSFSPRVAFLPHSLGKHHRSPPGWGSHCPGPTNSWPQRCNKIPMDEDKLLKWYIVLYTPQQKFESYLNGQSWKVIKDFHFHTFTNASCLVSNISMNHLDLFPQNWTPSPWNSAPRPMSTLRRRRRQRDHDARRQGRRDGAPSKVPGTSWWSKVDGLF